MPHLHTKPGEHDHTASAFIIRLDGDEPRIVLHMHKKLNRLLQFGGHVETLENPFQAVIHEIREESGYELDQLQLLQPVERVKAVTGAILHPVPLCHNTHPFNDEHFHTDSGYAFVTEESPRNAVEKDESADIRLLSRDQLADLPEDQTFESVRTPALFMFDVCLDKWERVDPALFA